MKILSPQMEKLLREVMLEDFDKEVIEKQLKEKSENAKINITYNTLPVVLTPGNVGPCC